MKKTAIFLVFCGLLQGCVAGAFVAGSAAGTTIAGDPRTFDRVSQDNQITYQITQQITADPELSQKTHIIVDTFNGVVLLAGQAPTEALRQQVGAIANKVPNIRRVFNEITVDAPSSLIRRSKDVTTTANIKTRMLTTTNLKSNQFKVVTENGTVFIMGLASRKQADIAVEVVRNSTGVKRVVKLIEYTQDGSES